jgi:hypothetical protein
MAITMLIIDGQKEGPTVGVGAQSRAFFSTPRVSRHFVEIRGTDDAFIS